MSSLCVTPSMTSGDWGCGGWGRGPAECIGGEGGTRCKGMVACMSGGGGLGVQSTGSGVGSRGVSLSGSIGSETESLVRLNLLSEVKRGRHIVSGDWLLLSDDSPRSFSCRRQPAWCLHHARRFRQRWWWRRRRPGAEGAGTLKPGAEECLGPGRIWRLHDKGAQGGALCVTGPPRAMGWPVSGLAAGSGGSSLVVMLLWSALTPGGFGSPKQHSGTGPESLSPAPSRCGEGIGSPRTARSKKASRNKFSLAAGKG